jgi:hypothetical protein
VVFISSPNWASRASGCGSTISMTQSSPKFERTAAWTSRGRGAASLRLSVRQAILTPPHLPIDTADLPSGSDGGLGRGRRRGMNPIALSLYPALGGYRDKAVPPPRDSRFGSPLVHVQLPGGSARQGGRAHEQCERNARCMQRHADRHVLPGRVGAQRHLQRTARQGQPQPANLQSPVRKAATRDPRRARLAVLR